MELGVCFALSKSIIHPTATVSVSKLEVGACDQFVEHAEQFAHDGGDGDLEGLAALHKALEKGLSTGLRRTLRKEAM